MEYLAYALGYRVQLLLLTLPARKKVQITRVSNRMFNDYPERLIRIYTSLEQLTSAVA